MGERGRPAGGPGARGDDDRAGPQRGTRGELDPRESVVAGAREGTRLLTLDEVDLVLAHVLLEVGGEPRTLGVRDGDEVLDRHRVQHLAAETFGDDAGADALARGVDRRGGTGRAVLGMPCSWVTWLAWLITSRLPGGRSSAVSSGEAHTSSSTS